MNSIAPSDMSNLMIARRLMQISRDAEARRNGKHVDTKTALDYYTEDQALISQSAVSANQDYSAAQPPIENININLADFPQNAAAGGDAQPQVALAQQGFKLEVSQKVEVSLELSYKSNTPVEGLIVHDQNFAETDRYLFNFKDGVTFTILDKWANKSTTVWGDPHVSVDDVPGYSAGDFKDLKSSNDFTTFMLKDGTRLTFKAKDDGLIEQVDIFKGSQHVKGLGEAAKDFAAESGLFNKNVLTDASSAASSIQIGDVVYAGGDGNDWFDANNKLIWGKTTGEVITQRPSAILEFRYSQTVTQSISVQTLATKLA